MKNGRNVGTIKGKSPKQDQTSAKDLTIELRGTRTKDTRESNLKVITKE